MAHITGHLRFVFFTLLIASLFASAPGMAQVVNGSFVGVVSDPSGGRLAGAQIVATNLSTGVSWTANTTHSGDYSLLSIPAGDYRLTVSSNGFKTTTIEKAHLQMQQTASINITLAVGSVTQSVTVESVSPLLQTQTSDVGNVITAKQIAAMPLNGRDPLQLATLEPGVNTFYSDAAAPSRGAVNFQGSNFLGGSQNVGSDITVGDSREISTQYRIDGINVTSPLVGQLTVLLSPDQIQEFKMEIGTAPAIYGTPQSLNMLSKSGTNQFHGTAYEYYRSNNLDGFNYFQPKGVPAPLSFDQFGGTVGGPLRTNKAFFFLGYEGLRSSAPLTTYATVPTLAELGGDFNYPGAPTIYDFNPLNPSLGTPFPNNTIPADRISPFAKVFNQFLPLPNFTGSGPLAQYNFNTTLQNPFDSEQGTAKIDYVFSVSDRLFGRYTQASTYNESPGLEPLYGETFPYSGKNIAVEETHIFNPRFLNVFRFGYTYSQIFVQQNGANGPSYDTQLGLKNLTGNTDPAVYGLPTVVITDLGQTFGTANDSTPRGGALNMFEIMDQVTHVHGAHTFNFGEDIQHSLYDTFNPTAPRGFFEFLPFYTGLYGSVGGIGLADYLLGDPLFALGDSGNSLQDLRFTDYDFYAQDDWRATPSLTLNTGVRYTYTTAPADALNHQSYFDPSIPGIVTAASGKIHNGIIFSPKANFAPRVGFAWSPFGHKTVIRGAYGLFFSEDEQAEDLFLRNNPPYYSFQFITNFPVPTPITSFFPAPATTPTSSTFFLFTVKPHEGTPYNEQWNLAVERQLTSSTALTVTYTGELGLNLPQRININQATLGFTPIQTRRPYPQFGDILESINNSSSNYNAVQVSIEKRLSRGFFFTGSYAHANGFDYNTDPGTAAQNRLDIKADYGPSAFLVRDRLVFDGTWDLPIGRGHALFGNTTGVWNGLIDNWEASLIELLQSGTPLTITSNNETDTGGFIETRANTSCNGNLPKSTRTLKEFFDISCFTQPPINTFGNSSRGAITGPGLNNSDISIRKTVMIGGDKSLRFDAEFFNAFNHPQFQAPITTVGTVGFGGIAGALSARDIQLSARFLF